MTGSTIRAGVKGPINMGSTGSVVAVATGTGARDDTHVIIERRCGRRVAVAPAAVRGTIGSPNRSRGGTKGCTADYNGIVMTGRVAVGHHIRGAVRMVHSNRQSGVAVSTSVYGCNRRSPVGLMIHIPVRGGYAIRRELMTGCAGSVRDRDRTIDVCNRIAGPFMRMTCRTARGPWYPGVFRNSRRVAMAPGAVCSESAIPVSRGDIRFCRPGQTTVMALRRIATLLLDPVGMIHGSRNRAVAACTVAIRNPVVRDHGEACEMRNMLPLGWGCSSVVAGVTGRIGRCKRTI